MLLELFYDDLLEKLSDELARPYTVKFLSILRSADKVLLYFIFLNLFDPG